MNSKIKKIMLLTTGLAGGLIATSVAGITLSSCTFQVQQDPNNNSNNQGSGSTGNNNSSNQITSPKDELTYNPNANYYTTQIVFDANGNITNASANMLTISNGLIFADPAMTTLIGIMPGFEQSQVTIPSTVKAITGYSAAVVYDTSTGAIVNPAFEASKGLVIGTSEKLLNLGSVGAFQKVGMITNGSATGGAAARVEATKPTMTPATGLSTLTSIQFANNSQLQTIGPKAFAGCNNLTSVALPDSCNTIGAQAFQNCTSLQSINLKGVQYIGDAAFNNAFIAKNNAIAVANPVSLNLSSAQYLGVGAFDSSVWMDNKGTTDSTNDDVQVLSGGINANGTPVDSGNLVETPHLSKISTVTFGSKLNTLSTYAFNGANYLTSADLSSCTSLANVSDYAFRNTANLTSVKFSNTIDTIGQSAFSGATALKSANFPSGLQTINPSAFSGCPLSGTFNPESTTLDIGQSAFSGSQFDTIDFSKVTGNLTIGNSAFANNSALKSMTFADNTKLEAGSQLQIKSQAFANCTNLVLGTPGADGQASTINWPTNLTLLANNAFPSSITFNSTYTNPLQINSETLISTNQLGGKWDVNQSGTTTPANNTDTLALGPQLFANNQNITNVDLSGSNIQALGWAKTDSLQSVLGSGNFTIPTGSATQTSNQLGTFANAQKLTTLTLPASCNQFGASGDNFYWSSPFANCKSLANINYNGFDLTPVSTGENAVTAGFAQMNQNTWTQVANIMNAFGYVGQQTINADNNISVDPNAVDGTWTGSGGAGSKQGASGGTGSFYQSGMIGWFPKRNQGTATNQFYWSNSPISSYAAGSYTVTTTPASGGEEQATANTTKYAAGLGAVAAYPTSGNGITAPGSTVEAPAKYSGNQVQSAWYTLVPPTGGTAVQSAGLIGSYLTGAPSTTSNEGDGAVGVPNNGNLSSSIYNGNWSNVNSYNNFYTSAPVAQADPASDAQADPNTSYIPIKMPANYNFQVLQNGLDANTTVAFLNHNGVVWKYEKNPTTGAITITGTVNYYLAGAIANQGNGVGGLGGHGNNTTNSGTNNGVVNDAINSNVDGSVLTSVDTLDSSVEQNSTFYGLDGTNQYSYSKSTAAMLLFSQKGGVDGSTTISATNGPKGLTVTLTLVPATNN